MRSPLRPGNVALGEVTYLQESQFSGATANERIPKANLRQLRLALLPHRLNCAATPLLPSAIRLATKLAGLVTCTAESDNLSRSCFSR